MHCAWPLWHQHCNTNNLLQRLSLRKTLLTSTVLMAILSRWGKYKKWSKIIVHHPLLVFSSQPYMNGRRRCDACDSRKGRGTMCIAGNMHYKSGIMTNFLASDETILVYQWTLTLGIGHSPLTMSLIDYVSPRIIQLPTAVGFSFLLTSHILLLFISSDWRSDECQRILC
jgi:hypothetical protein